MKKTLALVIAMMMIVALLAGCDGNEQVSDGKRTDINIPWHPSVTLWTPMTPACWSTRTFVTRSTSPCGTWKTTLL